MSDTCLFETWTDTSSSLEINDTPLGKTGVSGEKHTLPRKFTYRKYNMVEGIGTKPIGAKPT